MKHSCQCQNIRNNTDLEVMGLQEIIGGFGVLYHCHACGNSFVNGVSSPTYMRRFYKENSVAINSY